MDYAASILARIPGISARRDYGLQQLMKKLQTYMTEEQLRLGHNVILEIDWQGARQVRESMPGCVTVFILPPSRAALEHRLRSRRTDSDEVIARRLRDALSDMQHYDEFDYIIINDELDQAIAELQAVLRGEGQANQAGNPALLEQIKNILV